METMMMKRRSALMVAVCLALGLGAISLGAREARAEPDQRPEARSPKRSDFAGVVNLNAASVEELMALPGIGPSKAERIVTFRKTRGGFKRVEDLMKVKGIGRKTFAKLKPHLALKGPGLTKDGAAPTETAQRPAGGGGKKTPMVH